MLYGNTSGYCRTHFSNECLKHLKTRKESFCIDCGKKLSKQADYYGYLRCPSCAAKERLKIPENNPNYVHGLGRFPYPLEFNEQLKRNIRKRDNFTCQYCQLIENKNIRKLDVHHIDYNKNNNNENNLISLCCSCHVKTNFNRDYWKNYYTEIFKS